MKKNGYGVNASDNSGTTKTKFQSFNANALLPKSSHSISSGQQRAYGSGGGGLQVLGRGGVARSNPAAPLPLNLPSIKREAISGGNAPPAGGWSSRTGGGQIAQSPPSSLRPAHGQGAARSSGVPPSAAQDGVPPVPAWSGKGLHLQASPPAAAGDPKQQAASSPSEPQTPTISAQSDSQAASQRDESFPTLGGKTTPSVDTIEAEDVLPTVVRTMREAAAELSDWAEDPEEEVNFSAPLSLALQVPAPVTGAPTKRSETVETVLDADVPNSQPAATEILRPNPTDTLPTASQPRSVAGGGAAAAAVNSSADGGMDAGRRPSPVPEPSPNRQSDAVEEVSSPDPAKGGNTSAPPAGAGNKDASSRQGRFAVANEDKEVLRQRAMQRRKEEEERLRLQKERSLAKLRELEEKIQAKDSKQGQSGHVAEGKEQKTDESRDQEAPIASDADAIEAAETSAANSTARAAPGTSALSPVIYITAVPGSEVLVPEIGKAILDIDFEEKPETSVHGEDAVQRMAMERELPVAPVKSILARPQATAPSAEEKPVTSIERSGEKNTSTSVAANPVTAADLNDEQLPRENAGNAGDEAEQAVRESPKRLGDMFPKKLTGRQPKVLRKKKEEVPNGRKERAGAVEKAKAFQREEKAAAWPIAKGKTPAVKRTRRSYEDGVVRTGLHKNKPVWKQKEARSAASSVVKLVLDRMESFIEAASARRKHPEAADDPGEVDAPREVAMSGGELDSIEWPRKAALALQKRGDKFEDYSPSSGVAVINVQEGIDYSGENDEWEEVRPKRAERNDRDKSDPAGTAATAKERRFKVGDHSQQEGGSGRGGRGVSKPASTIQSKEERKGSVSEGAQTSWKRKGAQHRDQQANSKSKRPGDASERQAEPASKRRDERQVDGDGPRAPSGRNTRPEDENTGFSEPKQQTGSNGKAASTRPDPRNPSQEGKSGARTENGDANHPRTRDERRAKQKGPDGSNAGAPTWQLKDEAEQRQPGKEFAGMNGKPEDHKLLHDVPLFGTFENYQVAPVDAIDNVFGQSSILSKVGRTEACQDLNRAPESCGLGNGRREVAPVHGRQSGRSDRTQGDQGGPRGDQTQNSTTQAEGAGNDARKGLRSRNKTRHESKAKVRSGQQSVGVSSETERTRTHAGRKNALARPHNDGKADGSRPNRQAPVMNDGRAAHQRAAEMADHVADSEARTADVEKRTVKESAKRGGDETDTGAETNDLTYGPDSSRQRRAEHKSAGKVTHKSRTGRNSKAPRRGAGDPGLSSTDGDRDGTKPRENNADKVKTAERQNNLNHGGHGEDTAKHPEQNPEGAATAGWPGADAATAGWINPGAEAATAGWPEADAATAGWINPGADAATAGWRGAEAEPESEAQTGEGQASNGEASTTTATRDKLGGGRERRRKQAPPTKKSYRDARRKAEEVKEQRAEGELVEGNDKSTEEKPRVKAGKGTSRPPKSEKQRWDPRGGDQKWVQKPSATNLAEADVGTWTPIEPDASESRGDPKGQDVKYSVHDSPANGTLVDANEPAHTSAEGESSRKGEGAVATKNRPKHAPSRGRGGGASRNRGSIKAVYVPKRREGDLAAANLEKTAT